MQDRHAEGSGTLFTAEYDPALSALRLIWPDQDWRHSLDGFDEGRRIIDFTPSTATTPRPATVSDHRRRREALPDWSLASRIDWLAVGRDYAAGQGRAIPAYLAEAGARAAGPQPCRSVGPC